ncbi:MAG: N-acetylneuraminate synthase family protein [bacterium]
MAGEMVIGDFRLGGDSSEVFTIAEVGINHNGDLSLARRMVREAAAVGASAVKFQSFSADRLYVRRWGSAVYDFFKALELSRDDHFALAEEAERCGIIFLSTPFDEDAADLLEELGVPAFKIASGDLTNRPLLEHVARKGKPIILSTGASYLSEVAESIGWISPHNSGIALLHCTSSYPTQPEDVNMNMMITMRDAFGLPVGYSDHTVGTTVPLMAVAMGASILEKHFTVDKSLPGPDQRVSADPREFAAIVEGIDVISRARGDAEKRPTPSEGDVRLAARRSIVARASIPRGTMIDRGMVDFKRPGTGIKPSLLGSVIGRFASEDIAEGEFISPEKLSPRRIFP